MDRGRRARVPGALTRDTVNQVHEDREAGSGPRDQEPESYRRQVKHCRSGKREELPTNHGGLRSCQSLIPSRMRGFLPRARVGLARVVGRWFRARHRRAAPAVPGGFVHHHLIRTGDRVLLEPDPVDRREVARYIPVGKRPWGIAVTPDGRRLYTVNGVSDDVSVIDTESRKVIATIPVGSRPWGIAVGGR